MNPYILKAMRYVDNTELFSKHDMLENANEAADIAELTTLHYFHITYSLSSAACEGADDLDNTGYNYWLDKFFNNSGENKNDYINEVERLK